MIGSEIGANHHSTFCPDIEEFIRKLAKFGYGHIYFNSTRALPESEEGLRRIAFLCRQCGVIPFAVHAPSPFLPDDESNLDRTIERHKKALDKAAILHCHSATFHAGSVEGIGQDDLQEMSKFIAKVGRRTFDQMHFHTVRELAVYAEKKQMEIALENLPRDYTATGI